MTHSLEDLLGFLTTASKKGWMRSDTAENQLRACRLLLDEVLEPEQRGDVRSVDIDDLIRRFHNRHPEVASASLAAYASRVRSALREFGRWREDPVNWKPPARKTKVFGRSGGGVDDRKSAKEEATKSALVREVVQPRPDAPANSTPTLDHDFPLRPGFVVRVSRLPQDLRASEAERLAAFLKALVQEPLQE